MRLKCRKINGDKSLSTSSLPAEVKTPQPNNLEKTKGPEAGNTTTTTTTMPYAGVSQQP